MLAVSLADHSTTDLHTGLQEPWGLCLSATGEVLSVAEAAGNQISALHLTTKTAVAVVGVGAAGTACMWFSYSHRATLCRYELTWVHMCLPTFNISVPRQAYPQQPDLQAAQKLPLEQPAWKQYEGVLSDFVELAADIQLQGPRAVAVTPDGQIYVADTGNGRVRLAARGPRRH